MCLSICLFIGMSAYTYIERYGQTQMPRQTGRQPGSRLAGGEKADKNSWSQAGKQGGWQAVLKNENRFRCRKKMLIPNTSE